MAGIAPVQLLGIMQEVGRDGRSPKRTRTVPEIAAATGYPGDDDLAQAIILPRRRSRDRSTRTSWGRRPASTTRRSVLLPSKE